MVDYETYMKSERWGELRGEVMLRAGWICELPGCEMPAVEVHHITYDRFGEEELTDLAALCLYHHRVTHDLSETVHRCKAAEEMLEPGDGIDCYCPECAHLRRAERANAVLREKLTRDLNARLHAAVGGLQGDVRYSKLRDDSLGKAGGE